MQRSISKSKPEYIPPSTISHQPKMFIFKPNHISSNNSTNRRVLLFIIILASFLVCVLTYSYVYTGFSYPYTSDILTSFRPLNLGINSGSENSTIVHERRPDPCFGKYIFVHQLPKKFNIELIEQCDTLSYHGKNMCLYLQNNGFGPPIFKNSSAVLIYVGYRPESWYATDQFTLEVIFHSRMKNYKCLTTNSSSANAFYVPFYAALEAGRNIEGQNVTVRDKLPLELMKYISSLNEWKAFNGSDHFFVAGRVSWDFRRPYDNDSLWGNKLMRLPEAEHILMLTIESTTYHKNEAGIPYPTYFHPSSVDEITQWQNILSRKKRNFLFAFAGAPRPWENSIRYEVINQCLAAKNECVLINCKDMTDRKCHNPVNVLKLFQSAKFCLQPPGDTPTRRSIFDSIVSGCVPVFFDLKSGPEQYVWYFVKNYTKYSVYIPLEDVKGNKTDIRKVLLSIGDEEVEEMRSEVIKMIPRIVYGNYGNGIDEMEKDAFDVAVDGILEKVRNLKMEIVKQKKSD